MGRRASGAGILVIDFRRGSAAMQQTRARPLEGVEGGGNVLKVDSLHLKVARNDDDRWILITERQRAKT